jgi:hypothetical protein
MIDNVVVFPRAKRDTPPQSIEEIHEKRALVKKEHIEMTLDDVMANVFYHLSEEGLNIADESCIKETSLVIESLRAALYKSVDFNHPLHDIANTMFKYEPLDGIPDSELPQE